MTWDDDDDIVELNSSWVILNHIGREMVPTLIMFPYGDFIMWLGNYFLN